MIELEAGKPYTVKAGHSGVGVTQFVLKEWGAAVTSKTPAEMVGGFVVFTFPGRNPAAVPVTIEAQGAGSPWPVVSETLNFTPPPPAPPEPFTTGIIVEQA